MLKDFTDGNIKSLSAITLHVDGGCEPKNPGGIATAAWVAFDMDGKEVAHDARIMADGGPNATNNYAEYCALGIALRWLSDQGYTGHIHVKSDSKLLVHQVLNEWKCNLKHLQKLRARIWELLKGMKLMCIDEHTRRTLVESGVADADQKFCVLTWVPREKNECADGLGRQAFDAYLKVRPKNQPRPKQAPPKAKRRAAEGTRFRCTVCDHTGNVSELRIEDGDFCCPMCQCPSIQF